VNNGNGRGRSCGYRDSNLTVTRHGTFGGEITEFIGKALSDPSFYVGLAAVFTPILVALVSRRRKKLFFDVACEAWLMERKGEKETESSEEKTKQADPVLFVIDLRNPLWGIFSWLGGLDISREQYERRISFSFGENARILEAEVVEENPQGIGAEAIVYHVPPDTLTLKPMLFNQGESIRLRVVVDNPYLESCRSVAYGGS
jgi:hypothetical protein